MKQMNTEFDAAILPALTHNETFENFQVFTKSKVRTGSSSPSKRGKG
jgi:hypothetical protein